MSELLATAFRLASKDVDPTECDLRRAVSTIYYALFAELCELCADCIAGHGSGRRLDPEWCRVYRALDHGRFRSVVRENPNLIDADVSIFGETLERLKALRHAADYDPQPFVLSANQICALIDEARTAMMLLSLTSDEVRRRLAFACIVPRRNS